MNREREPLPTRVQDTPELPSGYEAASRDGFEALGWAPDPAARAAIDGHIRLLLAWTQAINLTAIRDPVAAATLHVLDSLTAVPILGARGIDRFLDLGSGGGLPGLPMAAALPAREALLVEPIGKKARFLDTAVRATGLGGTVRVAATRAEALAIDPAHRGRWPAVTARAVASTGELIELAFPLLQPGGILVAWKRGDLTEERRGAASAMTALGGGRLGVEEPAVPGLADHRLVVVMRTGAVPDRYPRDPAARRRRPW